MATVDQVRVRMVLQSPDGQWRIEVAQRGVQHGYRLINEARDIEMDWLAIGSLEFILAKYGVDMADLVEVTDEPSATDAQRGTAQAS